MKNTNSTLRKENRLSQLSAKIELFESKFGARSNKVIALRLQYANLLNN